MKLHLMLLAVLLCCVTLPSRAADKPNIVVILVDDMGFSDIGSYGGEISTPNLDALAKNGLRFSNFYNTARCCPTRASLMTGLYSHQAGVGHMTDDRGLPGYSGRLNDKSVTFAEALKPAGYFTAMTGKWHVGQNLGAVPWERGFDRSLNAAAGGFFFHNSPRAKVFLNGVEASSDGVSLPKQWYSTDLWTQYGLRFIDEARAKKQPFLLYLAHNAPHFPLQAPPEDIARWRGKFKAGWDKLRAARYQRQIKMGLIDKRWPLSSRAADVPAWDSLTPEQQERYDHIMAIYAATMERMDKAIGDLVKGLQQRGELENTLILFMSDNGGNAETGVRGRLEGQNPGDAQSDVFVGECWATLNNTPFVRYKHYTDEGGIATPLIAYWPKGIAKARRGQIEAQPGHVIDIMATCLDVAGAAYPKEYKGKAITPLQGTSLRPAFAGKALNRTQPLFWEHEENRAVRDGNWKLVALANKPWRLYDLATDRTEQRDLALAQPERVKALAAQWDAWAARSQVLPLGGWRAEPKKGRKGQQGQGKLSQKTRFELKNGDTLERSESPSIAGRGFTITAKINAQKPEGVIVAQGGIAQGYALYLQGGKLVFALRRSNELYKATTTQNIVGAHEITAKVAADGVLSLTIDGTLAATGKAPGPLTTMPVDGLQVGNDTGGLVGAYGADNKFGGTIESVVIEVTKP
jgi:arylsulfatase